MRASHIEPSPHRAHSLQGASLTQRSHPTVTEGLARMQGAQPVGRARSGSKRGRAIVSGSGRMTPCSRARSPLVAACFLAFLTWAGRASADPATIPPEVGYNYAEQETPRMMGLGGPMRATSNGLSSLYSNPANMAIAELYHVGAFAQLYPESRRQSYGGAVVDSLISSTGLSGGLGGVWSMQDPDGMRREWLDLRFAMAMPLGDMFAIGLLGKYVTIQQNGYGPLGFSEVSGGMVESNIVQTVTFDAGVTLQPVPGFKLALTGNNLTNPETALLPLMGGIGMGFGTEDFSVSADAVLESRTFESTNLRVNGGAETLVADRVSLRGGYRYDQGLQTHSLSGGLGYVDQRFSVDASFRRGIVGEIYTAICFGFSIHIESLGLGESPPDSY